MEKGKLLAELAHLFHTPLTGLSAGADLLGRLVPELRAKQADPLKELVKRNSSLLKYRVDEFLSRFAVEGDQLVLRLTVDDVVAIRGQLANPSDTAAFPETSVDVEAELQAETERMSSGATAPVPVPRSLGSGPLVLVADDERDLRMLVATALRDQGYRVIEARNGAEALEMIEAQRPGILVLDGLMPKVGGLDVCQQSKALDPSYHPKVILVTAVYKRATYRYEAAKAGVDQYLTKPFQIEELLQHVARLAGASAGEGS
jgi:Response regulator containing CheY-like receiver, AAA-type ATPase, and DNA-binding domains